MGDISKVRIDARIDNTLSHLLTELNKKTAMSKTDIVELALIDFFGKWSEELVYEGIDFKQYIKSLKYEKLRRIQGKQRNEFLSKNLMIGRINVDIMKLIIYGKGKKDIKNIVMQYIDMREKEANLYEDNQEILEEIDTLKEKMVTGINDVKDYIDNQVEDVRWMKQVTQKNI